MKIFNSLDATSICRCMQVCVTNLPSAGVWFAAGLYMYVQVCQRWRYLCSNKDLWKKLCFQMGLREGLGDIVSAVEVVHRVRVDSGTENTQLNIDWKQTYRDLSRLMDTLKSAVIKSGWNCKYRIVGHFRMVQIFAYFEYIQIVQKLKHPKIFSRLRDCPILLTRQLSSITALQMPL